MSNHEPCTCLPEPYTEPCGSEECGGEEAVNDWHQDSAQHAEEYGTAPHTY